LQFSDKIEESDVLCVIEMQGLTLHLFILSIPYVLSNLILVFDNGVKLWTTFSCQSITFSNLFAHLLISKAIKKEINFNEYHSIHNRRETIEEKFYSVNIQSINNNLTKKNTNFHYYNCYQKKSFCLIVINDSCIE
jgi:hypothetical protein